MTSKLTYVSGASILSEGDFGISPSQLATFFSSPTQWHNEQVLGNKAEFQGNSSSYLGTVVHYVAEAYTKTGKVDLSEIYKYLFIELCSDQSSPPDFSNHEEAEEYLLENADKPDIDIAKILGKFRDMGNMLIEYIDRTGKPSHSEDLVKARVEGNYYVSGSLDAYDERTKTITDYKTTSLTKPKETIPYNYKLQLLCYAYIYRELGFEVERIQIVWITQPDVNRISEKTGKPLKDYPCQVVPVTYVLQEEDWNLIDSILKLVAETVQASKDNPELKHIIWKDYRLKEKPKNIFLRK